jgi:hypothetical protein
MFSVGLYDVLTAIISGNKPRSDLVGVDHGFFRRSEDRLEISDNHKSVFTG